MSNAHPTAGSIEIINKLVINVLRSMLDELRWPTRKWAHLLFSGCAARALLKDKEPLELALGIPRENPIEVLVDQDRTARQDLHRADLAGRGAAGPLS